MRLILFLMGSSLVTLLVSFGIASGSLWFIALTRQSRSVLWRLIQTFLPQLMLYRLWWVIVFGMSYLPNIIDRPVVSSVAKLLGIIGWFGMFDGLMRRRA